jgi:hypothetical protein
MQAAGSTPTDHPCARPRQGVGARRTSIRIEARYSRTGLEVRHPLGDLLQPGKVVRGRRGALHVGWDCVRRRTNASPPRDEPFFGPHRRRWVSTAQAHGRWRLARERLDFNAELWASQAGSLVVARNRSLNKRGSHWLTTSRRISRRAEISSASMPLAAIRIILARTTSKCDHVDLVARRFSSTDYSTDSRRNRLFLGMHTSEGLQNKATRGRTDQAHAFAYL